VVLPLGAGTVLVLVYGNYRTIERVLRYVALLFLTYVGAAFLSHPDWAAVLRGSFVPHFDLHPATVSGALALLGTTLTAYAYVWETIELSEENRSCGDSARAGRRGAGDRRRRLDVLVHLGRTGATLGIHHKGVQTAQNAAQALAPIAGPFAQIVFAIGLLGSALIAIPVIRGHVGYVAAEMFGWRRSLDATFAMARAFYVTLSGCTLVAIAIGLAGVPPIKLLFFSGIAGGIATPLTMALMAAGPDATVR